jgi:D-alanyl-D-alanine-carboxypeptidase/D-alanyl-D-alanine-endopeptidase
MFFTYWVERLPSLFIIIILSSTIVLGGTITSVVGLSPPEHSSTSTYLALSSPQNEKNNSSSTFRITEEIKDEVSALVDNNNTNAAIAIGLVDPNGTQFYGYGKLSNVNNATVDENTIFGIGSITKIFTTILLADMVDDGLIKLNDPIDKYLSSNVNVPQYNEHKITIEDLATHTSGLPEFPYNYCKYYWDDFHTNHTTQFRTNLMDCTKNYTIDELYQGLSNTTITREPGTKFEYSSFGTSLLGHILTLKSNMSSYDELLTKRILSVLGMNSTSNNPSDEQLSRLATGHLNSQELPIWNLSSTVVPAGGLYSSVSDMLKFVSANIGLIKTKLDNAMQESHLIRHFNGLLGPNNIQASDNNTREGFYVGLGWVITTNFGSEVIWHNGITANGYNAIIAFNPTNDRGIVILSSSDPENIDIANIGLSHKDKFPSLIWNLLNQ